MIGPGKFGSAEALRAAMARGDCEMRIVRGKELYFCHHAEEDDEVADARGREMSIDGDIQHLTNEQREQLMQNFFDASGEEIMQGVTQWFGWAIEPDKAKQSSPPASATAPKKLQEAFDGISFQIRKIKKQISLVKTGPSGSNAMTLAAAAMDQVATFEQQTLKDIEALMMTNVQQLSDTDVKKSLVQAAIARESLMKTYKDLRNVA